MSLSPSIESPSNAAQMRLRRILKPGATVYAIMRHLTRRNNHAEISFLLIGGGFTDIQDISKDVASALRCVYGANLGVFLPQDPACDSAVYVAGWLSELCGYASQPLRAKWL